MYDTYTKINTPKYVYETCYNLYQIKSDTGRHPYERLCSDEKQHIKNSNTALKKATWWVKRALWRVQVQHGGAKGQHGGVPC